MSNEDLIKMAAAIRDGKASEDDKLNFFRSINKDLQEMVEIAKKLPKKSK